MREEEEGGEQYCAHSVLPLENNEAHGADDKENGHIDIQILSAKLLTNLPEKYLITVCWLRLY